MQQYVDIALKLIVGMIGILAFLRITGKAQMAQITPLDTVSAFVIGALVGGVLYNPDMRSALLRRLIKGESVYLVKGGLLNFKAFKRHSLEMEQFRVLLREKGIFSLFDLEDVRFETNGSITVSEIGRGRESFLIVNNGAIVDSTLTALGKNKEWALRNIQRNGFQTPSELFCMEWTPHRGFYLVAKSGDVKRGDEEIAAEDIPDEVLN